MDRGGSVSASAWGGCEGRRSKGRQHTLGALAALAAGDSREGPWSGGEVELAAPFCSFRCWAWVTQSHPRLWLCSAGVGVQLWPSFSAYTPYWKSTWCQLYSRHMSHAFPFSCRKQRRGCEMYLNSVNLNSFILRHVSLHSGFNHMKGFSWFCGFEIRWKTNKKMKLWLLEKVNGENLNGKRHFKYDIKDKIFNPKD